MTIEPPTVFKWRHFQDEIIVLCIRWYLRYGLSYRDLEEMMAERGLKVDHSTIARWVFAYAPELEKRVKPLLKPTNDSWKVDETYIKVKGEWRYQYRAVDSDGQTIEFFLSVKRDTAAAQVFFEKALGAPHTVMPRVIDVDQNAAYPKAVQTLKTNQSLPPECELRQVKYKYLNNWIEQDHRFIKRRTIGVERRAIVSALLYLLRAGCAWRMLPREYPKWQTVYHYFREWEADGTWERMHTALREAERREQGRETTPSAAIIDSQSVKTLQKGGLVATMAARRSTDASATSSSIPLDWS